MCLASCDAMESNMRVTDEGPLPDLCDFLKMQTYIAMLSPYLLLLELYLYTGHFR